MLQLVAALMLAAAPAAQADPAPKAEPAPKQAQAAADAPPAKPAQKPLTEAEKKMLTLAGMFEAMTHDNLATYDDLLKAIAEPKDCAASAKAVAARSAKHEADQAKMHAESDAFRKGMPASDQQAAAGKALFSVVEPLKVFRAKRSENDAAIASFKGKCPKEGPAVEKPFAALHKLLVP